MAAGRPTFPSRSGAGRPRARWRGCANPAIRWRRSRSRDAGSRARGRAWCDNSEGYRDDENRLPRGRSYVRNGSVVDLQIAPGRISAIVSGSELYRVTITIKEAAQAHWRAICTDCAGGIDSLVELLQGRLSQGWHRPV